MSDDDRLLSNEDAKYILITAMLASVVSLMLVEWPILVWSSAHGDPTLMNPSSASIGGLRWAFGGFGEPREMTLWHPYGNTIPPLAWWFVLDLMLILGCVALASMAWLRVDSWRSRRHVGLPTWDPRSHVTPRAWAVPRDLKHLQVREPDAPAWRKASMWATNVDPLGVGETHDRWPVGRLQGASLRSARETHLMVVAPTRAGKTTRVLIPALLDHQGPAIVLSNKSDVIEATARHRESQGAVRVFAPMNSPDGLAGTPCGWTPLDGCRDWELALQMGRWIFDADPSASRASDESGGARFYNREAVSVVLPPVLHAAALDERKMAVVHEWLRASVGGLDEPWTILSEHGAHAAANLLAGVQSLDERPRSLLLMSAAQLVDVYRFRGTQQADRRDFVPQDLLDGGTLYLLAPDSGQTDLAPIFGGLLGSVLRVWEDRAASGAPSPLLKIFADEAANLAPLGRLPTYLSVSGGWHVRWCLVYQSLAQLRQRYGHDADTILGNVLCKLFLGPIQDETTRRYLSELLDDEMVTERSWARRGLGSPESQSRHERWAPKVSSQRIMQLRPGQAVVVHGRDLPAITNLPAYWERNRGS